MVFWPSLPMEYRPPLPMVYQTLSYGIMNSSFGRNEGGSIYHEGVQNSYGILNPMVNWTRGWFTYDILTPGSISLMVLTPGSIFCHCILNPLMVNWTPLITTLEVSMLTRGSNQWSSTLEVSMLAITPSMIYHTWGEHASHYTINVVIIAQNDPNQIMLS
jgi:hypothetical protein